MGQDSINDNMGSMTFSGDVPLGSYARLIKVNVDRPIDDAMGAAKINYLLFVSATPDLVVLISSVEDNLILSGESKKKWKVYAMFLVFRSS